MRERNRPGRLPDYDYSSAGYYFITFCTRNRDCCLSSVVPTRPRENENTGQGNCSERWGNCSVGRGALAPPRVILKEPGLILDGFIQNIPNVYPGVVVDKYVIMPNHVHLLIQITRDEDGGARAPRPTKWVPGPTNGSPSPTNGSPDPTKGLPRSTQGGYPNIQRIVGGLKSLTRRKVGKPIWQTSFYDHIIRDEADYLRIWDYIDTNPAKWEEDEYYAP